MRMTRRSFLRLGTLAALMPVSARWVLAADDARPVLEVYKSPWCGCCGAWVDHMHAAGFDVRVNEIEDLAPIKEQYGVDPDLQSCHTAVIDGYVIEGHVPAQDVLRLLTERPAATGLSVPGMPVGSPGMEHGARRDPYEVILFSPSGRSAYARY